MKIYTRLGDKGRTSLFSGEQVPKCDQRIEAYGDIDELNSMLGVFLSVLPSELSDLEMEIRKIQSELFQVGAWLATTPGSSKILSLEAFKEEPIRHLESAIDRMQERLTPLKSFILPGGHLSSTIAHVARTICRRPERHVIRAVGDTESNDSLNNILAYLNRLSDYLFILARYCNQAIGVEETWLGKVGKES